jgi:hypothetical protein
MVNVNWIKSIILLLVMVFIIIEMHGFSCNKEFSVKCRDYGIIYARNIIDFNESLCH